MIGATIGVLAGSLLSDYVSMAGNFGSPVVQVTISAVLIAIASLDLCMRKRVKPAAEVA